MPCSVSFNLFVAQVVSVQYCRSFIFVIFKRRSIYSAKSIKEKKNTVNVLYKVTERQRKIPGSVSDTVSTCKFLIFNTGFGLFGSQQKTFRSSN